MLLTYGNGLEALSACTLDKTSVNNQQIKVSLRTNNWQQLLEEELNLQKSEGQLPSVDGLRNTLLDDDIAFTSVTFEASDDEDEENDDSFLTNESQENEAIYGVVIKNSSCGIDRLQSGLAEKPLKTCPPRPANLPTRPLPCPPTRAVTSLIVPSTSSIKSSVVNSALLQDSSVSMDAPQPLNPSLPLAAADFINAHSSEPTNSLVFPPVSPLKGPNPLPPLEMVESADDVPCVLSIAQVPLGSTDALRLSELGLPGTVECSISDSRSSSVASPEASIDTCIPDLSDPLDTSYIQNSNILAPISHLSLEDVDASMSSISPVDISHPLPSRPVCPPLPRPIDPSILRPNDPPLSKPVDPVMSRPQRCPSRPVVAPKMMTSESGHNSPPIARQPQKPQQSSMKHKKPVPVKMINHIGIPTNVSHAVHATSIEEAQELIKKLIGGHEPLSPVPNEDIKQPWTPVPMRRKTAQNPPIPVTRAKSEFNLSATSELKTNIRQSTSMVENDVLPRRAAPPTPVSCPVAIAVTRPMPAPRREVRIKTVKDSDVCESDRQMPVFQSTKRNSVSSAKKSSSVGVGTQFSTSPGSPLGNVDILQIKAKDGDFSAKPVVSVAPRMVPPRPTSGPVHQKTGLGMKDSVNPASLKSDSFKQF